MTKICDRCGQTIRPSEGHTTTVPDSMSGARPTVYRHVRHCKQPQTTAIPRTS